MLLFPQGPLYTIPRDGTLDPYGFSLLNTPSRVGIRVLAVEDGTAIAKQGLQPGTVITEVNGVRVLGKSRKEVVTLLNAAVGHIRARFSSRDDAVRMIKEQVAAEAEAAIQRREEAMADRRRAAIAAVAAEVAAENERSSRENSLSPEIPAVPPSPVPKRAPKSQVATRTASPARQRAAPSPLRQRATPTMACPEQSSHHPKSQMSSRTSSPGLFPPSPAQSPMPGMMSPSVSPAAAPATPSRCLSVPATPPRRERRQRAERTSSPLKQASAVPSATHRELMFSPESRPPCTPPPPAALPTKRCISAPSPGRPAKPAQMEADPTDNVGVVNIFSDDFASVISEANIVHRQRGSISEESEWTDVSGEGSDTEDGDVTMSAARMSMMNSGWEVNESHTAKRAQRKSDLLSIVDETVPMFDGARPGGARFELHGCKLYPDRMGVYQEMSQLYGGRPVFGKASEDDFFFLYYTKRAGGGAWRISRGLGQHTSKVCAFSRTRNPLQIEDWFEAVGARKHYLMQHQPQIKLKFLGYSPID